MRYPEQIQASSLPPLYAEAGTLQDMLLFTVVLALFIGVILLWLGRHGRVMWLTVWSAGLIVSSILYIGADLMGYV